MRPRPYSGLADATDALVRVDDAEDVVAAADLDGERLESGDLHGWEFNLTPQPPSLKGRGSLSINSAFPSREGGWGVRSGPAARRKRPSRSGDSRPGWPPSIRLRARLRTQRTRARCPDPASAHAGPGRSAATDRPSPRRARC